ncbi:MAG: group 1 truncated hemoglobin [Woeseiaceae bacterium]|nr:group 1 truncated hemoglobin [Woeseiaceae bacterium]
MIKVVTKKFLFGLAVAALAISQAVTAGDMEAGAAKSLYERLGSWDGISQIVADTIALHQSNPEISHFFADVDADRLAAHVTAFFAAGTGGPAKYEGRDMTTAHAGMGLSDADFDSAVADVLKALDKNGIDEAEKTEVAAILESLRPAVMGATGT